jgi:hypothetical protein
LGLIGFDKGALMPYKVIQWATGYVGLAALKAIIQDAELEGTPSLRTTIDMAPSLDPNASRASDEIQAGMHSTAACALRAIPAVCNAEPGIFTMPVDARWTIRNRPS